MSDPGDENDFKPHPNLSKAINDAMFASAIEGGAWLKDLPIGKALKVTTQNSIYTLRKMAGEAGDGVEVFSPGTYRLEQTKHTDGQYKLKDGENPVLVKVNGSTWGGSMLKVGFVGRGMHLECVLPSKYGSRGYRTLTTSKIVEVEEID